jgi:hypothetical protein
MNDVEVACTTETSKYEGVSLVEEGLNVSLSDGKTI